MCAMWRGLRPEISSQLNKTLMATFQPAWPKSCDCKHTEAKGVSGNALLGKFLKLDVWKLLLRPFLAKKKCKFLGKLDSDSLLTIRRET